jgi:hypothetical protein
MNTLTRSLIGLALAGLVLVRPDPALAGTTVERDSLQRAVLGAIRSCATYASYVLLDAKGESRCEYDLLAGKWQPYEPAWHTGQIIYGLLEAYRLTGDTAYLAAAKRGGEWWMSLQIRDHPVLGGMLRAIHGAGINAIIFATVSDGTNGIFELSRETGDQRYAGVATEAGRWMLKHMYIPGDRLFYDAVDPATGEAQKVHSPFWADKPVQVLTDVARPNNEGYLFLDMFRFTGDSSCFRVFVDVCEGLVEKQGPEGLWMEFTPNNKAKGSFHPRFNLWYAESLIQGYELTGRREFLDAALRTLRWYAKFQKKDGTIFYDNFLNGSSIESSPSGSTVAFAGLLWLQLYRHGVGEEFIGNIERSFRWIMHSRFSVNHPDPNLAGGVYNLRVRGKGEGMAVVQRDLGTSFGLRFLAAYYRHTFQVKPEGGH